MKKYAFINNKLIDISGCCGLILPVSNAIYVANVIDSRYIGRLQYGKIQKDITLGTNQILHKKRKNNKKWRKNLSNPDTNRR